MLSGSGLVANVTVIQTTVLMATVTSMIVASELGSPGANLPGTTRKAIAETMNEVIIALISDHALIRHQYQRRISTSPVPAPSASRNLHARSPESSCGGTAIEARNRDTVAIRATGT